MNDRDFIEELGPAFLPHLLRRLSDRMIEGGAVWAKRLGVRAPPQTHSTMFALADRGSLSVTELADLLCQSHPLVIKWIGKLTELGFVTRNRDPDDARKSMLRLSAAGKREMAMIRHARSVNEAATQALIDETGAPVWTILWEIEAALREKPYRERAANAEVQIGHPENRDPVPSNPNRASINPAQRN